MNTCYIYPIRVCSFAFSLRLSALHLPLGWLCEAALKIQRQQSKGWPNHESSPFVFKMTEQWKWRAQSSSQPIVHPVVICGLVCGLVHWANTADLGLPFRERKAACESGLFRGGNRGKIVLIRELQGKRSIGSLASRTDPHNAFASDMVPSFLQESEGKGEMFQSNVPAPLVFLIVRHCHLSNLECFILLNG